MAVTKCKECGGKVSTKADACPSCGAKIKKGVGVIGWLFVLLVVLPFAWFIGTGMDESDKSVNSSPSTGSAQAASTSAPVEEVNQGWSEHERVDAMTDEKVISVSLKSTNSTLFERPYHLQAGSFLTMTFRKNAGEVDAYFAIDKGQMICGVTRCSFSLRVGDGQVQSWTGIRASSGGSDIMFVRDAAQLKKIIAEGSQIRVGIEFYKAGPRVFEFDPAGFPGL